MNSAVSVLSNSTEAAIKFLRDIASLGFWGNVTFKLQHGDVVHVTREESIPTEKLIAPDTRRNYRDPSK